MGSCHTPPVGVTACQQCGHSLAAHGPATCGVCSEEEGSGLRPIDQVCGRQPVPPSAKRGRESVRFLWIRVNRNDEESVAWLMKVILVFPHTASGSAESSRFSASWIPPSPRPGRGQSASHSPRAPESSGPW